MLHAVTPGLLQGSGSRTALKVVLFASDQSQAPSAPGAWWLGTESRAVVGSQRRVKGSSLLQIVRWAAGEHHVRELFPSPVHPVTGKVGKTVPVQGAPYEPSSVKTVQFPVCNGVKNRDVWCGQQWDAGQRARGPTACPSPPRRPSRCP